jgi:gliding motility-associated-like protein
MSLIQKGLLLKYTLILIALAWLGTRTFAQDIRGIQDAGKFIKPLPYSRPLPAVSAKNNFLLPPITAAGTNQPQAPCQNTAFYMRMSAPAGQQISLTDLKTMTDGSFVAAAQIRLPDGRLQAALIKLDNNGAIASQRILSVDNEDCTIDGLWLTPDGLVHASGFTRAIPGKSFVIQLSPALTTNWVRTMEITGQPLRTYVTVGEDRNVFWASQSGSIMHYGLFSPAGVLQWTRTAWPANATDLVAVSNQAYNSYTIAFHGQEGGLPKARYMLVNATDGSVASEFAGGQAGEQTRTGKISHFNNRLLRLETHRSAAGAFTLKRHIQFYAQENEVTHTFTIPGLNDFLATAAMDHSGDVMGVCLPTTGRFFFLKQFGYYQTRLEKAREYQVPIGATLISATRSFDGGFLFGLNTQNTNEILLLKTDSAGQVPTCSSTTANILSTEQMMTANPVQPGSSQSFILQAQNGLSAFANTTLTGRFDCFANTCLPPPPEDSCLASYYRVFRSNSYGDYTFGYALMRGQRHLLNTGRYNRVLPGSNTYTSTLKLVDDRGGFLKAVNLTDSGKTIDFTMHRLNDRQVMIVSNNSFNTVSRFGITLVDENLNMVWSKTINSQFDFSTAGVGVGDVHKDAEGNFYLAGTKLGFGETPKCTILKLDPNGNMLWSKTYQWPDGLFGMISITSTPSSVVAIIETSNENKTTIRLSKTDGSLLNSYRFKYAVSNSAAFYAYKHPFAYSEGNIYYSGHGSNDFFLMGKLDSTGRPLAFKTIQHDGSITRAGTIHQVNIYASYVYYDGQGWQEVLLKADTALKFNFIRQVARPLYGYKQGLQISDNGSIYAAGVQWYDNQNFDSYLAKFDADGYLGTCVVQDLVPPVADVALNPVSVQPTSVDRTITVNNNTMTLVPDPVGLSYAQLLCSSTSNCSTIDLRGPSAVCELDTDVHIPFATNPGCTLKPGWIYDTAFAQLQRITDTSTVFRFRKAGNIQLKATINAGCRLFADSLIISVRDARTRPQLGADTVFCPGDTLRLSAGPGFASYRWQDGNRDSVYNVRQPGTYRVSVTNLCGNTYGDTIVVQRAAVPLLNLGNDTTLCPASNLSLEASAGFSSYTWTLSNGSQDSGRNLLLNNLSSPLSIRILARTVDGCVARDSLDIGIFPTPSVSIGPDIEFCSGDSVRISGGAGYLNYTWNNGNTTSSIVARTTGQYWLQATDVNGCVSSDTMSVTVNPLPVINLGADRDLCAGETLTLDPGNFSQYRWQDGSTNRTLPVTQAGVYWVTVTNNRGCVGSDSLRIGAILPSPSDFLQASVTFCKYQDVTLSPARRFNAYLWSTGARQQTLTVDRGGRYTLEVTDLNGCRGRDTIQVIENDCLTGVFIPNAFTPNGDNLNDRFMALVYGRVISFKMQVYNRFGELVYSTTDPRQGWDGIFKGKGSPAGNFVWQCSYQLEGSEPVFQKGTVMLIR